MEQRASSHFTTTILLSEIIMKRGITVGLLPVVVSGITQIMEAISMMLEEMTDLVLAIQTLAIRINPVS